MSFQHRTAAVMAFTAAILLILPTGCCARLLHGVASATSVSTGGISTSISQSLGDFEVITAAIATKGGDASAMQSADSGKHTQVTVAHGTNSNAWTTSTDDGKPSSWNDVPACKASPSRTNSVKDVSGRLWGYEANTACAYKDPKDHHPVFYWEAAPACPGSTGADSVTDSQGRVWGWAHGASCAYKDSHHRKLTGRRQLAQSSGLGGNDDHQQSTQDGPPTAQPANTNTTAAAQYESHAWARSWSTATSWHWSSTGGNTTQEVHAEAETDAYSNNGTAMADATTHAAINGTTADASAHSTTTGDVTTATANVSSTQATKLTARRLLQPVHAVMPLSQNGAPLSATTTPEVFQNVPPLSTAADVPPQANITSSPSPDAAPNGNSNAPSPAPVGVNLASTSPSHSIDNGTEEASSNKSTAVKAASTPAPHSSPVPSSPALKKVNSTSPGLQHSGANNSTDILTVGAGATGAGSAANVINSTADTVSVSVQNSTAGSGNMAVQCQTVTNIYGQKSLKCEKVADYSAAKPLPANMVGSITWQAAEWVDSTDRHNNTSASSPSPQALPVNTAATAAASGDVTSDVHASSAGSVLPNLTTAHVSAPGPAAAQTSSTDNIPSPAAVSPAINPMSAATPSSGPLTVPQLNSQVVQASPAGSIIISPVIQPVISPVISPQIIITINPSAGSNATAAAVPTASTANVTVTEATKSFTNGPVTVEFSPAESNTSSAVVATDDVSSSAAEPMTHTSEPPEDAAANTTAETTQSTTQTSPEPAVASVVASPAVPAPSAATDPSPPAASVAVSTSAPTWDTAPACAASPTKDTSVQDTLGRLWWSQSGVSCAYRDAATGQPVYYTGYQSITWESAPDCDYAATNTNTMPDTEGRAWGWQQSNSRSCKFVTQSGAALMHQSLVARTS